MEFFIGNDKLQRKYKRVSMLLELPKILSKLLTGFQKPTIFMPSY